MVVLVINSTTTKQTTEPQESPRSTWLVEYDLEIVG